MKQKKDSIWQDFVRALKLPEQAIGQKNQIEIFDRKELTIEDAYKILEYDDSCALIQLKNGRLAIYGQNIRIDMFVEKTMVVRGEIHSVSFE